MLRISASPSNLFWCVGRNSCLAAIEQLTYRRNSKLCFNSIASRADGFPKHPGGSALPPVELSNFQSIEQLDTFLNNPSKAALLLGHGMPR